MRWSKLLLCGALAVSTSGCAAFDHWLNPTVGEPKAEFGRPELVELNDEDAAVPGAGTEELMQVEAPPAISPATEEAVVVANAPEADFEAQVPTVVVEPVEEISPPAPVVHEPQEREYTVQEGDTLQRISMEFYGTTRRWPQIYSANKDRVNNPDRIVPGQKLRIPNL